MGRPVVRGRATHPRSDTHNYGYYLGAPSGQKRINHQMMEGRDLVDIGMPDGWTGGTGPSYGMELDQVQGYANYSQDIQPANDLR